jgi:hypothetical protein
MRSLWRKTEEVIKRREEKSEKEYLPVNFPEVEKRLERGFSFCVLQPGLIGRKRFHLKDWRGGQKARKVRRCKMEIREVKLYKKAMYVPPSRRLRRVILPEQRSCRVPPPVVEGTCEIVIV